jgi:hypothetical protein
MFVIIFRKNKKYVEDRRSCSCPCEITAARAFRFFSDDSMRVLPVHRAFKWQRATLEIISLAGKRKGCRAEALF